MPALQYWFHRSNELSKYELSSSINNGVKLMFKTNPYNLALLIGLWVGQLERVVPKLDTG